MIKRFITNRLQQEISEPEVCILLGARQVGKTTLLKQLERYTRSQGETTSFFDLEQPDILSLYNQKDAEIIHLLSHSGKVVFIDEFQYIKNASKILKAIVDAGIKVKIYCSGSSSLAIHQHMKESLAGRRVRYLVYPLSYSEIKATHPSFTLKEYLRFGGMPGLRHAKNDEKKQQLLAELISSYIIKDARSLVKEENIRAFNHLVYLLAERQGSMLSLHSLANEINMSAPTVQRYLDILEETYIGYRVFSYSTNLGNELKKSYKIYLYDIGIRNVLLKDFSPIEVRQDKGAVWENFVFLKLKSTLKTNMDLRFWRTKKGDEVDFILLVDRKPLPIEVKSYLASPEVPVGLKRFLSRYPKTSKAYVINENLNAKLVVQDCQVLFLTFEDFSAVNIESL